MTCEAGAAAAIENSRTIWIELIRIDAPWSISTKSFGPKFLKQLLSQRESLAIHPFVEAVRDHALTSAVSPRFRHSRSHSAMR
jgi:hypothetical protein